MYKYVRRSVLIADNPCNHCDDSNRWYLHELIGGSIRLGYEGCGGFMGRAREQGGKEVDRNEAIADLERRIGELHEEQEELLENLHEADEMLRMLRLRRIHELTIRGVE
ncbi:MAG: hypothetical protein ABIG71_02430 [Candidatus Uhrbacteria bacterium]